MAFIALALCGFSIFSPIGPNFLTALGFSLAGLDNVGGFIFRNSVIHYSNSSKDDELLKHSRKSSSEKSIPPNLRAEK